MFLRSTRTIIPTTNSYAFLSFFSSGTTAILLQPESYAAVITQLKLVRYSMKNLYTIILHFFTHEDRDRIKYVIDNKLPSNISGRSRLAHNGSTLRAVGFSYAERRLNGEEME